MALAELFCETGGGQAAQTTHSSLGFKVSGFRV